MSAAVARIACQARSGSPSTPHRHATLPEPPGVALRPEGTQCDHGLFAGAHTEREPAAAHEAGPLHAAAAEVDARSSGIRSGVARREVAARTGGRVGAGAAEATIRWLLSSATQIAPAESTVIPFGS